MGRGGRKVRMHKAGAPGERGREQRQPEGAGRGKGCRRRVEARKTAASQQPCLIRVCCRAWTDPWRMREWGGAGKGLENSCLSPMAAMEQADPDTLCPQPLTDNLDS